MASCFSFKTSQSLSRHSTNKAQADSGNVLKYSGESLSFSTERMDSLSNNSTAATGADFNKIVALHASSIVLKKISEQALNFSSMIVLKVTLEIKAKVPSEPTIKCLMMSIGSS